MRSLARPAQCADQPAVAYDHPPAAHGGVDIRRGRPPRGAVRAAQEITVTFRGRPLEDAPQIAFLRFGRRRSRRRIVPL